MERIEVECPSCSPTTPVPHVVLKGTKEVRVQCEACGSVQRRKKPRDVQVRIIVSKGDQSFHRKAVLSGRIQMGDEFLVDDEATGEADLVQVTSLEVGEKRESSGDAEDIRTIWARTVDEVPVKISVPHKEVTESIEMRVPGDREFVVGETIRVNSRELVLKQIKIRDGNFKRRKGASAAAKEIKRIYAEPEFRERRTLSKRGRRVVIKKRDSLWSLKSKGTG